MFYSNKIIINRKNWAQKASNFKQMPKIYIFILIILPPEHCKIPFPQTFLDNLMFTPHPVNMRDCPGGSAAKNLLANGGGLGLIPELGRSPAGGNGNPLQYSCLENSKDRGD